MPVLLAPAEPASSGRDARKREAVDAAADAIPDARVHWFVGDHDIHAQHPDELAGVMHDFATAGVAG